MPSKKTPTPDNTNPLGTFEGRDVLQVVARITNAGDGLSKALNVRPIAHRAGDEVTVVMRCTVGPITHDIIKDTDVMARIETLKAGTVTIVADEGVIAEALDEQERRIEEAAGIQRLPMDGPEVGE